MEWEVGRVREELDASEKSKNKRKALDLVFMIFKNGLPKKV